MNKLNLLILTLIFISCESSKTEKQLVQENKILKQKLEEKENVIIEMQDINTFIPRGYDVVKSGNDINKIHYDLNNDGIKDYALLLAQGNSNSEYSNSTDVRLSIFEGQNNGTYKLKSQTGNLTSSFLHSNLSERIKISNKNVLSLIHQSMRHDYELKFRYEKKNMDYMLIGSEFNNYNSGNTSTNFLSGKRIITEKESITKNIGKGLKPISAVDDNSLYELICD